DHRHADYGAWLYRTCRWGLHVWLAADRRVHDLQFLDAGHGPDHQLFGQDPLYVGRADREPDRVSWPERSGRTGGCAAFPMLRQLVRAYPWAESGITLVCC